MILTPPGNRLCRFATQRMWLLLWLLTAHYVSRLHSQLSPTPSIAVHGSFLPVNSDRCGLRGERLRPSACPPLYPDTAPSSRCRARMSAPTVINSLWRLHKFRYQPETSACLSELSITDCCVPFSNAPEPYCQPHSTHPQEK